MPVLKQLGCCAENLQRTERVPPWLPCAPSVWGSAAGPVAMQDQLPKPKWQHKGPPRRPVPQDPDRLLAEPDRPPSSRRRNSGECVGQTCFLLLGRGLVRVRNGGINHRRYRATRFRSPQSPQVDINNALELPIHCVNNHAMTQRPRRQSRILELVRSGSVSSQDQPARAAGIARLAGDPSGRSRETCERSGSSRHQTAIGCPIPTASAPQARQSTSWRARDCHVRVRGARGGKRWW